MCEFANADVLSLQGSGKSAGRWFRLGRAQVYHDHFISAQIDEGVVIDLMRQGNQLQPHVCLELSYRSARELAESLLNTLNAAEERTQAGEKA